MGISGGAAEVDGFVASGYIVLGTIDQLNNQRGMLATREKRCFGESLVAVATAQATGTIAPKAAQVVAIARHITILTASAERDEQHVIHVRLH